MPRSDDRFPVGAQTCCALRRSDARGFGRGRSAPLRSEKGFALLLTLTLLAFVVLLLVGLGTYTRVETAIAGNTQRQTQARENALLALNVALAQLQRQAGPDTRVTATAETAAGADAQKRRYTGVWDTVAGTGPVWLASGAETPAGVDITAALPAASRIALVGTNTDGSTAANATSAALVDVTVPGVPGQAAAARPTIGRYAWWVGDQGVKAPVAVADDTAAITYAPYDSAELRSRLRQQLALGAGAASAAGAPVFEPRDANNRPLVAGDKIVATNQLALLRNAANATLNPATVRQNFHAWSPNNLGVLANTKLGGLRQDLSLRPDLLGAAFAAWANYTAYMEPPVAATPTVGEGTESPSTTPTIFPDYSPDPLRRRYRITPPGSAGEPGVTPVLSYFYLFFGVRKPSGLAPFTLSLRWSAALWNPYTSALVPEDLRLEISGLPTGVIVLNAEDNTREAFFPLRSIYGDPFVVTLPWTLPSDGPVADKQSWLPGRVYNWTFLPDATLDPAGNPGRFDSASLGSFSDGLQVSVPGSPSIISTSTLALSIPEKVKLTVRLVRASDGATLATYTSPEYDEVPISSPSTANANPTPVGYLFRLAESVDTPANPGAWLTSDGIDPRAALVPSAALVAVPNGPNPALYDNFFRVYEPDRLLNRDKTDGTSYNEDVPVFELPRMPILSAGSLQHLPIPAARPFAIGNPWGAAVEVGGVPAGAIFDRYFFSGLAAGTSPTADANGNLLLPDRKLKVLRKPDGSKPTESDLRETADTAGARSTKFLLQGGAFNLNSTQPAAWRAVLRSGRLEAAEVFEYLNVDESSGTVDPDVPTVRLPRNSVDENRPWEPVVGTAAFFRFPQSAQETYKAEPGLAETGASTPSPARTDLFRRGLKVLSEAQTADLAAAIAARVAARQATSGPFRSVEDFLNEGIVEAAIGDVPEINQENGVALEFSSQFLTQADIMTALAPVLFPRSDTFVVRTYGEAVNPVTGATEGRAWAEATVQRVPEYFDPSQPPETLPADLNALNALHGRRFKVVSFRWLTRSDI